MLNIAGWRSIFVSSSFGYKLTIVYIVQNYISLILYCILSCTLFCFVLFFYVTQNRFFCLMCQNIIDIEYLSVFEWLSREASALRLLQSLTSENEASLVIRQPNETDPLLKLQQFFMEYRRYSVDHTDFHRFFWRLDPTLCQLALLNGEIIGMHKFLRLKLLFDFHCPARSQLTRKGIEQ